MGVKVIFLDSSFLVSLGVDSDQNHNIAEEIKESLKERRYGEALISDYVFDEIVTVTLQKTKSLERARKVGDNLRKSMRIIGIDREIFEESWRIFKNQKNTKFSFTDCSIIAVMDANGIKNIATFDKDFKKVEEINVVG